MADPIDLDTLVKPDAVHGDVYTDPRVFAEEMKRIYGTGWRQYESFYSPAGGGIHDDIEMFAYSRTSPSVRRHVQRVHGGRSEYTLTDNGNNLRIAFKKVSLVGIDEHLDNVTFLL